MEGYDEFYYFGRPQRNEKIEPMGPNHPCWLIACGEIESLLRQAGRVFDQKTVESIAMNSGAWGELIEQASENRTLQTQSERSQILRDFLSDVRSESRVTQLFGDNVRIGRDD